MTLIVGPAGTGKTAVIDEWARSRPPGTVAWVAFVDPEARNRFWPTVADALGLPGARSDHRLPVADQVLQLLAEIEATVDRDVVLVVDGYELGEDPDLAASLALFIRRLPTCLRLVVATRTMPLLPIDRMRVAGELHEIDAEELWFTPEEARQLVRLLEPGIDAEVVDTIVGRADGWAAALRLGALAWAGRHEAFESNDTFRRRLDHYVMREVFGTESGELVDFLSDLAVVERAPIGLVRAITTPADADVLLSTAEDRGLFISRVGSHGEYRIHPAVREALLTARERTGARRVTICRERAARWYERAGDTIPALEQYLLADDHQNALRLLSEQHLQLYDAGGARTVGEVVAKLAPAATARNVESLVDLAWCQVVTDPPAFRDNVAAARWWADHGGDMNTTVGRRLLALESLADLTRGDYERSETRARAALDGYDSWHLDPIVQTTWNDIARVVALQERWDDEIDEIRELGVMLRRVPARTIALEATRALGAALTGRPIDALRVAVGVRTSASMAHLTISSTELAIAELIAHRELGEHSGRELELEQLLAGQPPALPYVEALAACELVLLHLDRGMLLDATNACSRLERIVAERAPGPGSQALLGRAGTMLSIEMGDLDQATRWATTIEDAFWEPISRSRVLRAAGDPAALEAADAALPRNPRHHVIRDLLRATVTRDRDLSAGWTQAAVAIALDHGMLQTLASPLHVELIERHAWQAPATWMERLRRATAMASHEVTTPIPLVEPLTVRERDVLRFLPSRLTLKEIADELFVSVNTLKFHLKIIYRKLGVNSRAEAADVARSWGRVEQR